MARSAPVTPLSVEGGTGRRAQHYTHCRADAEVIGDILAGAGHVWTADNEAMLAFFARHGARRWRFGWRLAVSGGSAVSAGLSG